MKPQTAEGPEDALRLLAAAVSTARLYPPASALPREAIQRFVECARELTATGPLRFGVEPHHMRVEGADVGVGQAYLVAFAEMLHALQVRQVIVIAGLTFEEAERFVGLVMSDPQAIVMQGGIRACLAKARVTRMGVVEVSLRATDDVGLLGMDLLNTPLDEVMGEIVRAAERRVERAAEDSFDEMAEALDRLDEAARRLALERIARGLMYFDDRERMKLLAMALKSDSANTRMEGVLQAFGRMKPAALARLLKLVGEQAGIDPKRMALAMNLPPEAASVVQLILRPSPDIMADYNVPQVEDVNAIVQAVRTNDDPTWDWAEQRELAAPPLAAGRALSVATSLSKNKATEDTIKAIGDVLPEATRLGDFAAVREALEHLEQMSREPSLQETVAVAQKSLSDYSVLTDACSKVNSTDKAFVLIEIVSAAGRLGGEVLLDAYITSPESQRYLLRPVLRGTSEAILAVARPMMRSSDSVTCMGVLRALAALGDRRSVPLIVQTLDQSRDFQVRVTAVASLGSMQMDEATKALIRALGHRDMETQRLVVKELGRMRAATAVPALARRFDDVGVLTRSSEMRKDIIASVAAIGTPEADKLLQRWATRPGFGRKSRELKALAASARAATSKEASTSE